MRQSYDIKWIEQEGAFGIGLAADHCAEHEVGAAGLREAFGLRPEVLGIEGRTMTRKPEGLVLKTGKGWEAIVCVDPWLVDSFDPTKHHELQLHGDRDLTAAWDDKSFAIVAWGGKKSPDRIKLARLWDAFQRGRICLWTNVGVFNMGTGLTFFDVDTVPQVHKDAQLEDDLDRVRLKDAAKSTGIEERLRKADRRFFALSPRWIEGFEVKSAHPVIFWLNPMQQNHNNCGWFTVEDLDDWIAGKGRIPKKAS